MLQPSQRKRTVRQPVSGITIGQEAAQRPYATQVTVSAPSTEGAFSVVEDFFFPSPQVKAIASFCLPLIGRRLNQASVGS